MPLIGLWSRNSEHTCGHVRSDGTQVPVQNQSQSDSGFKDLLLVKNSSQGASVQHVEICTGLQRPTYPDHHWPTTTWTSEHPPHRHLALTSCPQDESAHPWREFSFSNAQKLSVEARKPKAWPDKSAFDSLGRPMLRVGLLKVIL